MSRARDKAVTLWLTADEKRTMKELAAWFGMNDQEYLRYVAMGRATEPPALSERAHQRAVKA